MIILDTNVLSALMQQRPEARVVTWLDQQPQSSVWTTTITVLEIRYGIQILEPGRRRTHLAGSFEGLVSDLGHRIAAFDYEAAMRAAELMAARQKRGRPVDLRDTMIAAIVLARGATLATRNTVHFDDAGIAVVNPWGG